MADAQPSGVKIVSIFYYIYAVLSVLAGLFAVIAFFAMGSLLATLLSSMPNAGMLTGVLAGLAIVIGIVYIGFGVLYFFMGKGIANRQKWAKILAIIFSILGLLSGILGLFGEGIFNIVYSLVVLIISAFIVYTFLINKEGKAW